MSARVPAGVTEGGQFSAVARAESDVELAAPSGVDPALEDALARYGLALDDVPADHEGRTLQERWEALRELAEADDIPSPSHAISEILGHPDFGRLRSGPNPIWWDEKILWGDDQEPEGVLDPDDPRWDDPQAVLAASVHTRNGGGNRECLCDDEEHYCLVATIDSLESHPAHLANRDDSGDRTYADFYFAIADKEAVRGAIRRRRESEDQGRARAKLAAIAAGKAAPWEVMDHNPDTLAAQRKAKADLAALPDSDLPADLARSMGIEVRHASTYYGGAPGRTRVHFTPDHRADAEAMAVWARGPQDAPLPDLQASWQLASPVSRMRTAAAAVSERTGAAREARAARAAIDEGSVSPEVAAVLEKALSTSFGHGDAERDLARALETLDKARPGLERALPPLRAASELAATRKALTESSRASESVLRWPGPAGTCPAGPAGPDPLSVGF